MPASDLSDFIAYQKAIELFDLVVEDLDQFLQKPVLHRLVSQHLASADSVCSNIEEGYGRESAKEYRRFLIIARGSLRETMGRYGRLKHWMPKEIIEERIALAGQIGRILTTTIKTLNEK